MHFYGVAPGVPRSEITIIESVSLRHIFFIFDQNWESLGIRDIGEKEAIFAKICFSKVRFFHSAMLASRTSFEVEAFSDETSHTFTTSREIKWIS